MRLGKTVTVKNIVDVPELDTSVEVVQASSDELVEAG